MWSDIFIVFFGVFMVGVAVSGLNLFFRVSNAINRIGRVEKQDRIGRVEKKEGVTP